MKFSEYRRYTGFWAGAITAMCSLQLYQDILGKERYIAAVQSGWLNTSWWMWAILIGATLFSHAVLSQRKRKQ